MPGTPGRSPTPKRTKPRRLHLTSRRPRGRPTPATAEEPHTRPSENERPPQGKPPRLPSSRPPPSAVRPPGPTRAGLGGEGGSHPGRESPPRTSRAPTVPAHKADPTGCELETGAGREPPFTEAWERATPGDGKGLRASNQNPLIAHAPERANAANTRPHVSARAAQRSTSPRRNAGPGSAGPSPDSEGGGAGHGRQSRQQACVSPSSLGPSKAGAEGPECPNTEAATERASRGGAAAGGYGTPRHPLGTLEKGFLTEGASPPNP